MANNKTLLISIIVSMIVGGIAGFAIDHFYFQHDDTRFGKTKFINNMTRELGLSVTQQHELDSIVTLVHPKFQMIRDKFNTDMHLQGDSTRQMIYRILSPEQQAKLQTLNKQNQ